MPQDLNNPYHYFVKTRIMSECIVSKRDNTDNSDVVINNIFTASHSPMFVGLINNRGRIILSSHDSVASLDKQKQEMFFTEIALQTRMYADFNEYFDSVKYSLTERGEMKILTIPTSDFKTIIMILDKHTDHGKIVEKIRAAITADGKNIDFNHLMENRLDYEYL